MRLEVSDSVKEGGPGKSGTPELKRAPGRGQKPIGDVTRKSKTRYVPHFLRFYRVLRVEIIVFYRMSRVANPLIFQLYRLSAGLWLRLTNRLLYH